MLGFGVGWVGLYGYLGACYVVFFVGGGNKATCCWPWGLQDHGELGHWPWDYYEIWNGKGWGWGGDYIVVVFDFSLANSTN